MKLLCDLLLLAVIAATIQLNLSPGANAELGSENGQDLQASGVQKDLNDLLIWSIENSNASELKAKASEALRDPESLVRKRVEIQGLIADMAAEPTERQLMEEALAVAKNMSAPANFRINALTGLRYLVEPIDNAMDLPKLGGISVLVNIIEHESDRALVSAAEYALGTAVSNNPTVQSASLAHESLMASLLKHALEGVPDESEKALYVISSLVSSNHEGQLQFYGSNGVQAIRSLLSQELTTRQHRKVLNLITDLTEVDGSVEGIRQFADRSLLVSLLEKLEHPDHDLEERAFLALISLSRDYSVKKLLRSAKGLEFVSKARHRCTQLLRDAGQDYREILENLLVLASDLEEMIGQAVLGHSEL